METMTNYPSFLITASDTALAMQEMCMKYAALLMFITVVYGLARYFFGFEQNNRPELHKYFFTPLIMLVLLANYPYVVDIPSKLVGSMVRNSPGAGKDMLKEMMKARVARYEDRIDEAYATGAKNIDKAAAESKDGKVGWFKEMKEIIVVEFKKLASWQEMLFSGITGFLQWGFVKVTRLIIEQIRNVLLGFLIAVGPVAILLSILPIWRNMLQHWFQIFVSVMLWALTLNILDHFVINYSTNMGQFKQVLEDGTTEYGNGIHNWGAESGFVNVVFAFFYLAVPMLTSFYSGKQLAGGFLTMMTNKVMGAMVGGAKMLVGAMGKMKGGGGSGTTSGLE